MGESRRRDCCKCSGVGPHLLRAGCCWSTLQLPTAFPGEQLWSPGAAGLSDLCSGRSFSSALGPESPCKHRGNGMCIQGWPLLIEAPPAAPAATAGTSECQEGLWPAEDTDYNHRPVRLQQQLWSVSRALGNQGITE